MHEEYDKFFAPATAIQAEGARIGLCYCKLCGAAILLDPRDQINTARLHAEWHSTKAEAERDEWEHKAGQYMDERDAAYRAGIERAAKIAGSYGPKVPVPGTEIAAAIRALLTETAGE